MSTLRLTTISNQSGSSSVPSDTVINGSAKAWVNFNGTGTVAIRASFNVSSITDNATGAYTVNFATPFTDANYSAAGICKGVPDTLQGSLSENHDATRTASAIPVLCSNNTSGAGFDSTIVCVSVFR